MTYFYNFAVCQNTSIYTQTALPAEIRDPEDTELF